MPPIFDIEAELLRSGVKPRGQRDEIPVPHRNFVTGPRSFGAVLAPHVSDPQVLGLPAANRAVNLIANGVASMAPLRVLDTDGVTEIKPTPNIAARPNATMTPFTFWHSAIATALLRGNFYGLYADFDPNTGFPRQVVPIPPQLVYTWYDGAGYIIHTFLGTEYSNLDLVHVPGMLLPGSPRGVGVVENFRRSLGAALELQFMAADTYSRGAVPTGVLEVPLPNPSPTTVADTKSQWIENMGGQRVPAVIPQGWKFTPISWSPEDAQFLQSRQFAIAEIAFMFGLDPTDLSASFGVSGGTMTYANVEQREIARVVEAYGPWMLRFEQAWCDMLPGAQSCKFEPKRLLRMDAKTQAEVDQLDVGTEVITKDEARAGRGLPPMTAAQKASLKPAAPPAVPGGPPVDPNAPPKPFDVPGTDITQTPVKVKA